jgi:hypothetical protein
MSRTAREPGFYWIRLDHLERIMVAEYASPDFPDDDWSLPGIGIEEGPIHDADVEVLSERLMPP